jgi:hypothetical protein
MKSVIAATIMLAHFMVSRGCCHDQNCHPVPCDDIKAGGLGLAWGDVIFTDDMIRDSLDEGCYVCIHSIGRYRYPYCVCRNKHNRRSECQCTRDWRGSDRSSFASVQMMPNAGKASN